VAAPSIQDLIAKVGTGTADAVLDSLTRPQLEKLARDAIALREEARRQEQILYYQPVSERAKKIHYSTAKQMLAVGGNRSSKTDTSLADAAICMTGIIPYSLSDYPKEKLQCPMRVRLVCESLTNTWEPVIKPKLQWDKWNGKGQPGGPRGHWGWIPRRYLLKGKWEESWSEKNRTLTLTCGCTLTVMSYDQDVGDFSGASLHLVIHDEGPPWDIYRENRMRTLDTSGRCTIAFTPPDDESKSWNAAWIYDELYEKGQPGLGKDPEIDIFELWTDENRILDGKDIEEVTKGLTIAQKATRTHGTFMHLSGRVYPMYTDREQNWCFNCNNIAIIIKNNSKEVCATCGFDKVTRYTNLIEVDELIYQYPTVFLLDPHPRKPNMMIWVAITPGDDYVVIKNMECDGDPALVRNLAFDFERSVSLNVVSRLIDPNMAESAAHQAGRRGVSVRDEFDRVNLRCRLADDAFQVGMKQLRNLFKPDPRTLAPRLTLFNTCTLANRQLLRYVWSEWSARATQDKDPKAIPRNKDDDYPTLLRYFAIENFTFRGLSVGIKPIRGTRHRRVA
jgi:phage terminase large subunit-like protein